MCSREDIPEEELLGSFDAPDTLEPVRASDFSRSGSSVDLSLVLVGRIIALKAPHPLAVKGSLRRCWAAIGDLSVDAQPDGSYIFHFSNPADLERAFNGGPWTVQGHWLSLKRWSRSLDCKPELFNILKVWIQLHGLPLHLRSSAVGLHLAKKAGKPINAEVVNGQSSSSKFVRVQIWIDARLPLCPGVDLQREEGFVSFIEFRYERLDVFCYQCGKLGHTEAQRRPPSTDCTGTSSAGKHRRFGPSLRASRGRSTSSRRESSLSPDINNTEAPFPIQVSAGYSGFSGSGNAPALLPAPLPVFVPLPGKLIRLKGKEESERRP